MTPAETLDRNPETMPVFLHFGFHLLQEAPLRATLGRSVTLAQVASLRGVNLAALLEALNQAVAPPQPAAPPAAAAPTVEQAPVPAAVVVPDAAPAPVPPVPAAEPAPAETAVSEAAVWDALRECYDPEVPVNIVDLGLVYHLAIAGSVVEVQIGLTSPACPLADQLTADVTEALLQVPGVADAHVEVVEEPQWTLDRMSDAAREQLGWPAPPGPNAKPMLMHF
ncbi:MAG: iron-sulfur cluster assembly protein [Chloroflexi bacterium]|nr:iron-sulfur cluster assembly protein [Chloroflexota bacterium]